MTSPLPSVNLNGSPPWSYELSNLVPLSSVPVYCTWTVSPVWAVRPEPGARSSDSSFVGGGESGTPSAGLKLLVGSSTGFEQAATPDVTSARARANEGSERMRAGNVATPGRPAQVAVVAVVVLAARAGGGRQWPGTCGGGRPEGAAE